MIVREILRNRGLAENFDFFNDYKDTMNWLRSLPEENIDDYIDKLFAMYVLAKAYKRHRDQKHEDQTD